MNNKFCKQCITCQKCITCEVGYGGSRTPAPQMMMQRMDEARIREIVLDVLIELGLIKKPRRLRNLDTSS